MPRKATSLLFATKGQMRLTEKEIHIMKNLRALFVLSSALVVAASVYGSSAMVQAASLKSCMAGGLTEAECACEAALEKGTKQAIRNFLRSYPGADTACSATAFVGPTDLGDENDAPSRNQDSKTPPGNRGDDDDDGGHHGGGHHGGGHHGGGHHGGGGDGGYDN
jgi:uncharacterized membrane protein YgcG